MNARHALRLASPLERRPSNPRPGVRRVPGCRVKPNAHEFAATEYVIWIGGVATRRMTSAPGGFVEVC